MNKEEFLNKLRRELDVLEDSEIDDIISEYEGYIEEKVSRGLTEEEAVKELGEFMKDKKTRDRSQEQLLDRKFKTSDGESAEDTRERMTKFFDRILKEYKGKKIAVVSHGGSIKFFLLNWCKVNQDVRLVYNNTILDITSPCLLKMTFKENKLINLEQIKQ